MTWYHYLILSYAAVSNIIAVLITIYDKKAAKTHKRRIPERTLLFTAALSGCVMMYITMKIIRHKTKHMKFMIGIPLIFLLEIITAAVIINLCSDWSVLRTVLS